jgi:hypothetical protein
VVLDTKTQQAFTAKTTRQQHNFLITRAKDFYALLLIIFMISLLAILCGNLMERAYIYRVTAAGDRKNQRLILVS